MTLDDFAVYIRLIAPAFLIWLAWVVHRAPYQDRSHQVLAGFLALVAAGFTCEFLWYFLAPYHTGLSEFFRGTQRVLGYIDPPILLLYAGLFARPRRWANSFWLWTAYAIAGTLLFIMGLPHLKTEWILKPGYPAFAWAEVVYVNGTYLAAFLIVLDGYAKEPRRHLSKQLYFLALGIGFVALSRSAAIVLASMPGYNTAAHWLYPPIPSLLAALAILVLGLFVHAAAHGRATRPVRRLAGPLALLLVAFFTLWSLLGVVYDLWDSRLGFGNYYGLRWIFFGILVAYGILRYQLFDFELRARQSIALLATLFAAPTLAILVGLAAQARGMEVPVARLWGLAAGAAAALPLFVVLDRIARFFVPPGANAAQERSRRLEVYEATLEYALRKREWSPAEQRFANTLREVLQVSAEEHEQVMSRLRATPTPEPAAAPSRTTRAPAP